MLHLVVVYHVVYFYQALFSYLRHDVIEHAPVAIQSVKKGIACVGIQMLGSEVCLILQVDYLIIV